MRARFAQQCFFIVPALLPPTLLWCVHGTYIRKGTISCSLDMQFKQYDLCTRTDTDSNMTDQLF